MATIAKTVSVNPTVASAPARIQPIKAVAKVAAPKVEAPATNGADVPEKADRAKKRPMEKLFGSARAASNANGKTSNRIAKMFSLAVDDTEMTARLKACAELLDGAKGFLTRVEESLADLKDAGWDPSRFGKGGAGTGPRKIRLVVGDNVVLSEKVRPGYAEYLSTEELDTLSVRAVTAGGKIVVGVTGTPKVIGVFRHNMIKAKSAA